MDYLYYPGCSLKGTAKDYEKSLKSVVNKLDITLKELSGWTCCGASQSHMPGEKISLALPSLTLAEADKQGRDLITSCAACFNRLKTTRVFLENNPGKKLEIEKAIGLELPGKSKVRHLLELLSLDLGPEKLASAIKKPLTGLKAVCYYGCLLTRPDYMLDGEKMEDPRMMDDLMEKTGVFCADWPYKTECCGSSFGLSRTEVAKKLSGKILKAAKNRGAECIIVACPMCHSNLDMRQPEIEKYLNEKFDLPVFYFTELLALALGINFTDLYLDKHIIDPMPLLKKKGFI